MREGGKIRWKAHGKLKNAIIVFVIEIITMANGIGFAVCAEKNYKY